MRGAKESHPPHRRLSESVSSDDERSPTLEDQAVLRLSHRIESESLDPKARPMDWQHLPVGRTRYPVGQEDVGSQ